jgi:hypothetical protein
MVAEAEAEGQPVVAGKREAPPRLEALRVVGREGERVRPAPQAGR